jgi:hypothetical protein
MPFDESLEEHRMAGVSLRHGMHNRVRLVAPAFANERCCVLGRWLYEDGARGHDTPGLQQLKLAHASFHAIVLSIAISITQGRLADAALMLEPDALFESAARRLAQALSRFEHDRMTGEPGRTLHTDGYIDIEATRQSSCDSGSWQLMRTVSAEY